MQKILNHEQIAEMSTDDLARLRAQNNQALTILGFTPDLLHPASDKLSAKERFAPLVGSAPSKEA